MNVYCSNEKIKKNITDLSLLIRKVGKDIAKSILKRLRQLESFVNVKELLNSGIDKPHLLEGNFYGFIGWSITDKMRLILDLNIDKNQKYSEEVLNKKEVFIKGVVDYHGNKNEWIIS